MWLLGCLQGFSIILPGHLVFNRTLPRSEQVRDFIEVKLF